MLYTHSVFSPLHSVIKEQHINNSIIGATVVGEKLRKTTLQREEIKSVTLPVMFVSFS